MEVHLHGEESWLFQSDKEGGGDGEEVIHEKRMEASEF